MQTRRWTNAVGYPVLGALLLAASASSRVSAQGHDNPTGTFVNWHANVSCDAFDGQ